jgi:predicted enzyme related to lactoylglutathione lyase
MKISYLEIVTPDVTGTMKHLEAAQGVRFSDPIPALGNARVAALIDGGRVGVRAPMRDDELPVIRPYFGTDDIQASVNAAIAAGATLALPPMPLAGEGTCAILIQGGNDFGFWQDEPA